jgi:hypothetical protein
VARLIRCVDHVFCKCHFGIVNNVRSCILNIVTYASEHCTDDVLPKSTKKCEAVSIQHMVLTIYSDLFTFPRTKFLLGSPTVIMNYYCYPKINGAATKVVLGGEGAVNLL